MPGISQLVQLVTLGILSENYPKNMMKVVEVENFELIDILLALGPGFTVINSLDKGLVDVSLGGKFDHLGEPNVFINDSKQPMLIQLQ